MYIDGELIVTDRERLAEHLPGCAACSRVVDRIRREGGLIAAAIEEERVPADLMAVIDQRLKQRADADVSWTVIVLPALLLIFTPLFLGLGLLPHLERLIGLGRLFLNLGSMFDFVLLVIREGKRLVDAALAGGPLLPSLTLLLACMAWLRASIRKGGYARG
jgi:predicted anti-sigma-YlaC factor YlaD